MDDFIVNPDDDPTEAFIDEVLDATSPDDGDDDVDDDDSDDTDDGTLVQVGEETSEPFKLGTEVVTVRLHLTPHVLCRRRARPPR